MTLSSCRSAHSRGMAAPDLSPWCHMLCFHSCPGWTSHHGTNTTPRSLLCHQDHFVFCAERSGCPSFFIFCQACCASGCGVCVCVLHAHVYTRARVCLCFHLFIHCTRYLLSAHCVPGTVAEFLWVCLLTALLLLWGPLSVLFCPQIATSLSVWVSQVLCILV